MDKLTAMRAFLRVVDGGTFTKAASLLDVPVSTVTRLVQGLESELKTQLLNRTTRRVTVTPAGALYSARARQILHDLDQLEGAMDSEAALPMGRIRVEVGAALARLVIVPALADFVARYPGIRVDLGGTDRRVDHVDCAVRSGGVTDTSLIARQIGELNHVCCASPAYLARTGMPAHPSDLARQPHAVMLYVDDGSGGSTVLGCHRDGHRAHIDASAAVSVNDANVALAACLAGLGVIQAPTYLVRQELDAGRLVQVLADWFIQPLPIHIVYPPSRHMSRRVRVFVDWLEVLFAETPTVRLGGETWPPLQSGGGRAR